MGRVKKEIGSRVVRELRSRDIPTHSNPRISADDTTNNQKKGTQEQDDVVVRRNLRSKYLAVKNSICVQKPREQVADAEAFLDITSCFVKSVKAQRNEGATPSDLMSCLLRDFGQKERAANSSVDGMRNLIVWKDIGLAGSHIFKKGAGCCTMIGPMNAEPKIRKCAVRRKHVKPTEMARPEELNNVSEEKTDTDKNMLTMFGVLRKYRKVRLENLVLNRISFAQTVENFFALSFLAKDGRAEITANENGHFVCPRNAPDAKSVESGKVCYDHFVLRFDFKDWKVMLDSVPEGEELMPHRVQVLEVRANTSSHAHMPEDSIPVEPERKTVTTPSRNSSRKQGASELDDVAGDLENETTAMSTPIRKRCRNRGIVLQEQTVVEDSPQSDDESRSRPTYIRLGKRKLM
ncbi:hypothetical protein KSS87_006080 [Heliosperma pusillum]|nr:hypothetical protein KSS87_001792 [Heliosperma pusillum]KAH9621398.1 hypothetical protein KSS87_006080 [Heliosperma pusillum]